MQDTTGKFAALISATTRASRQGRVLSRAVAVRNAADIESCCPYVDRVYIGWEFCPSLFPTLGGLRELAASALSHNLEVTVATPFLPPADFERIGTVLDRFFGWWQRQTSRPLEVVVNDLGLLRRLAEIGGCVPVLGRLLNKQARDPRIAELRKDLPPELADHLSAGSCGFSGFVSFLAEMGIRRVEYDNLLQGVQAERPGLVRSLHFPYGYLTTGRKCAWAETVRRDARSYAAACGTPCVGKPIELKSPRFQFRVWAFGNTLFYVNEHVDDVVRTLGPDRLVYTPGLPWQRHV